VVNQVPFFWLSFLGSGFFDWFAMPKFGLPWRKKKGDGGSEPSGMKDSSMNVFGHTVSLDEDDPNEEPKNPEDRTFADDAADDVLGLLPAESCCPSLSLKWRIIGFLSCLLLGLVLCGIGAFIMYTDSDKVTFAVLYSIGNVVAIASTMFLTGPRSQFKKCIHPTRLPAALVFIAAFTITLVLAFSLDSAGEDKTNSNIILLFLIIQWLALLYYALTLFPCAYNFCAKICKKCCKFAAETV